MENYRVGINLSKLDKSAFSESQSGDKWVNLTMWRNSDGQEDQYGNLGRVKQDLGMDRKGEDTPIIGNFKGFSTSQNKVSRPAPPTAEDDNDIPF